MMTQVQDKLPTGELHYWPDTTQLTKPAREVSTILNVHYNTLFRWIKSGKLECIRFGKTSIHLTYDQVEQFINNNRKVVTLNME